MLKIECLNFVGNFDSRGSPKTWSLLKLSLPPLVNYTPGGERCCTPRMPDYWSLVFANGIFGAIISRMVVSSAIRFRLALGGIVGIILIACWFWSRPAFPIKITLKDGTELRVLGVDFGNFYVSRRPTIIQRLRLQRPRPFSLDDRPVPPHQRNDVYTIAYEHNGPVRKGREFRLEDENGWSNVEKLHPPHEVGIIDFETFPKRSKFVKLMVSSDKSVPLGEVKFKNPFYSTAPKWINLPLPRKSTVQNFDFILTEAESLPFGRHSIDSKPPYRARWTHLRMKINPEKDPILKASIVALSSHDATGNSSKVEDPSGELKDSVFNIWFQDSMWPVEPIRFDIRLFLTTAFTNRADTTVSFVVQPRIME